LSTAREELEIAQSALKNSRACLETTKQQLITTEKERIKVSETIEPLMEETIAAQSALTVAEANLAASKEVAAKLRTCRSPKVALAKSDKQMMQDEIALTNARSLLQLCTIAYRAAQDAVNKHEQTIKAHEEAVMKCEVQI